MSFGIREMLALALTLGGVGFAVREPVNPN
jgi:hypothetical protein